MIPILGALPPESIFPFAEISAPSVSATGMTNLALPSFVARVGRYSLLIRVGGGWGTSPSWPDGAIHLLDGAGATILAIDNAAVISPAPIFAEYWQGSSHVTGITDCPSIPGSVANGTWLIAEGCVGVATVSLIGHIETAGYLPTSFSALECTGLGRGRRDPLNLSALISTLTPNDTLIKVVMS